MSGCSNPAFSLTALLLAGRPAYIGITLDSAAGDATINQPPLNRCSMKYQTRLILLLATALLSATIIFGATEPPAAASPQTDLRLLCDVWSTENGLPQNTIQAVLQTRDGYLWISTQEGLVRYDGLRFTVFDTRNTKEMRHNNISELFEDRDGRLWIASSGGLLCYDKGKFTSYTTRDGLSSDVIETVLEDRQGNLWIGTSGGGLNRFRNGSFTRFTARDGFTSNQVWKLLEDHEGSIWIGTESGLCRFRDGQFHFYTTRDGLAHDYIYALRETRDHSLWIGTRNGLTQMKNGVLTTLSEKDGLTHTTIRALFEDQAGALWVGTEGGGVLRYSEGRFSGFTMRNGLSDNTVQCLTQDREGSLWIGTSIGGLNRLRQGNFFSWSTREGLPNDFIRVVYEGRDGSLWIGSMGGGLSRIRNGKITSWTTKDGLPGDSVRALFEDSKGALWIGTDAGLSRFSNGRFTNWSVKDGLSHDAVRAIYEDHTGALWIGTRGGGIDIFRDGRFSVLRLEGFQAALIRVIYEDSKGRVWIGGDSGLTLWQDGRARTWTTSDGLSNNMVFDIHEDRSGTLWVGTYGGGLNRFRDGRFTPVTVRNGLFDNIIYRVLEDDRGWLWMTCNKGIYRARIEQLNAFADGKIGSVTCQVFGLADGMKSSECNGGNYPAGWRSRDGRMWFPTVKGVVEVNPDQLIVNRTVPPVAIERMLADDRPVSREDDLTLPPGQGRLEIHYTALSFVVPERVSFKYKLEGFDQDWIEAGNRRAAYYTNLPPGSYRFRVIACNDNGVWNEAGAAVAFRLKPHFYQTWWFYVLCALSAGGLAVGIWRFRVRQLKATERELAARVAERTRELQEEIAHRQRIENALRDSEEHHRRLFEDNPLPMWVYDLETLAFLAVNRAATNEYGYACEEFLTMTIRDIRPPEEVPKLAAVGEGFNHQRIWKHRKKDGTLLDVEIHSHLITFAGRRAELVLAHNVTERLRAERELCELTGRLEAQNRELNAFTEKLARSNRELESFASIASHDLQEPLRKVQAFGDRLKNRYSEKLDETARDYIARMQSATARMQTLINDLLAYSRVATRVEPFRPVNLHTIAREVVSDLEARIERTGGRVEIGELPVIEADPTQMRQVLQNLIGNGLKFHKPDTPPVVSVSSEAVRGADGEITAWQIRVEDNGIGFDEKYLEKIFAIFQRLHGQREYEGTGIGLAVVRRVIERHGGHITARSQPNQGATFILTLPASVQKQAVAVSA